MTLKEALLKVEINPLKLAEFIEESIDLQKKFYDAAPLVVQDSTTYEKRLNIILAERFLVLLRDGVEI